MKQLADRESDWLGGNASDIRFNVLGRSKRC